MELLSPQTGLAVWKLVAVLIPLLLVLYAASVIWAYRDAERRGKEGLLAALLVALVAWPVGLIVWLAVRPHRGALTRDPP